MSIWASKGLLISTALTYFTFFWRCNDCHVYKINYPKNNSMVGTQERNILFQNRRSYFVVLYATGVKHLPTDKTLRINNSSVIRHNDKSQNEGNKKTKHVKISEKPNISYPLIRICPFALLPIN